MGEAKRRAAGALVAPSTAELRAEIGRLREIRRGHARARRGIEALAANLCIQTLRYALGEAPSPTARIKTG